MIYRLNVEGYEYPVLINADVIPIMYLRKIEKNLYELAIIGTPDGTLHNHHYFTIDALKNPNFIKMMGGEVEE